MEVNWSTFILEIINFLILVWILKRFLYKPVMDAIARRRASIEQSMQEAGERNQEAEALKTQYEHRLEDWEQEKQAAREQLHTEIEQEREKLETQLRTRLQHEQEKASALATQQAQEQQRLHEQRAMQNSMQFTSKLLKDLSSAELESRLIKKLLEQLAALPDAQRERLAQALNEQTANAQISTAFPISPEQGKKLQDVLQLISGRELTCEFKQDDSLLAGVRIQLGPWQLQGNLQDELQAFAEFEHNPLVQDDHE